MLKNGTPGSVRGRFGQLAVLPRWPLTCLDAASVAGLGSPSVSEVIELTRFVACIVVSLVLSSVGSFESVAQQATSFAQLQAIITGDTVSVTDVVGNLNKGKIAQLSGSSLRLLVKGAIKDFQEREVSEIRRSDKLTNGAVIGTLGGLAVGVLGAINLCRDSEGACSGAAGVIPFTTLCGTGIGVGVDALIKRQMIVYRPGNSAPPRITLTPLVSAQRQGLTLSFAF